MTIALELYVCSKANIECRTLAISYLWLTYFRQVKAWDSPFRLYFYDTVDSALISVSGKEVCA